jgi:predicted MFS family arabinose efflux permease
MSTRPSSQASVRWASASVRLAIALAFADASVVVLALPQIVERLHTSISHVTWVITAYNLALILCTIVIVPFASRLANRRSLVTGLAVFGLASLGAGTAGDLTTLIVWRCIQGAGAALLLSSSLPLLARGNQSASAVLRSWAATAALGAGLGPAAGGVLTQLFDWRAIFLAQAPVAAVAAVTALGLRPRAPATESESAGGPAPTDEEPMQTGSPSPIDEEPVETGALSPGLANVALAFISAGLIGALFLATILLINVWQVSPLGAAAVLAVIPLATAATEWWVRRWSALAAGAAGSVVLAAGLLLLALITHRQLGLALIALGLCGAGLGLAFPALTRVALETHGQPVARAARTVAAREGGLILGLVLLTPLLVNQLSSAPNHAVPQVTKTVVLAPIPLTTKLALGASLVAVDASAPSSQLPDLHPAFFTAGTGASPTTKLELAQLEAQVQGIIQSAVTHAFRKPLLLCVGLSLLALVPLAISLARRRPG